MKRFREQSELGWLMLQMLGAICLPFVTRDAQRLNRPRAGTDSVTGSPLPQTRSPGPAPMNCDVDPPEDVRTYAGRQSLWWLSYADDHRCAGVAIVSVPGEQSVEHAAEIARALGLTPAGDWQVAGIQMFEEDQALAVPYVGRFLSTTEAAAVFAAQSIRSFEEETGRVVDLDGIQLVESNHDDAAN